MTRASSVVTSVTIDTGEVDPVDITQYIDDISERQLGIEEEEVTPFGTSTREWDTAGIEGYEQITFSGFLSDDANHPYNLLDGEQGTKKEMVLTWISGNVDTVNALIISVNTIPQQRNLTRYSITVRPEHVAEE